ncbi:hypothetical protein FHX49_002458 [Microbacterium endophyticum]|uniref:D-inositol 3-phosphate glycosyltransferase n=1 Tax=Microbacterium endophyticum TaxID=1526412 RepID=A0A7W4YMV5_9MICO|nr:DUF6716 putative glycosyltransferase [Microbacterium endophyticum]MBB2976870.1 hypothetical protein [Microbacterium endophyticum]NIK35812.1 hypothetical protein [Microbacterium endophyticum]
MPRIVAVADSDSYVKWAAALLGTLPPEAGAALLIVETRGTVSAAQQKAALHGSGLDDEHIRRVEYSQLADVLRSAAPDAVLLAARGPVVRVLARAVAELDPRPVLVTGLPGISIPATTAALIHRTQCDLFILHSHAEVHSFTELARFRQMSQRFALARLPFLAKSSDADAAPTADRTDLVFASQAIVPRERADRLRVVQMLVRAAQANPERRVVLKERAVKGELQTHRQKEALPDLLARVGPVPPNLVVSTAPMSRALETAEGLVTVSSTAALEAVARGIPIIALDTFGVSPEMINPVFVGSGLFGSEEDVVARRFRRPTDEWLRSTYFHAPSDDNWVRQIADLVALRRAGSLPIKPARVRRGGAVRDAWERKLALGHHDRTVSGIAVVAVGIPLRVVVRLVRRATVPFRAPAAH